jgi:hypothetical protein
MSAISIYHLWPQEGFASIWSSNPDEWNPSLKANREEVFETLVEAKPLPNWIGWQMTMVTRPEEDQIPDITWVLGNIVILEQAARKLLAQPNRDFELLPFTIDGNDWRLLRPLRWVDAYEPTKSTLWNEVVLPDGTEHRVPNVSWINIVDPRALQWDAFKLSFAPRQREFYTQRFVDRCDALGLKGVRFEHVGYVVDSAEHAVPPPPRPVPEVPQAPRWPRWREASAKEKALVQSGGLAWLVAHGLSATSSADAVLAAITAEVEALRPVRTTLKPKARNALFNGVGGAFALLLERDLQWRWVDLPVSSRSWGLGMASPNGSHALCLDQVTLRQMMASEPPTITLLFNMIAAGNLPDGQPGDHVAIG